MGNKFLIENIVDKKITKDLELLCNFCSILGIEYNRNAFLILLTKAYKFRVDLSGVHHESFVAYILYLYTIIIKNRLNKNLFFKELKVKETSFRTIEKVLLLNKLYIDLNDYYSINQHEK